MQENLCLNHEIQVLFEFCFNLKTIKMMSDILGMCNKSLTLKGYAHVEYASFMVAWD